MANDIFDFKRVEKKYLLSKEQYEIISDGLSAFCEKDDYGEYSVFNVYYDTNDYYLIRRSLDKPFFKQKMRVRSYGTPDKDTPIFLELKRKYDGVVYKRRTKILLQNTDKLLRGEILPSSQTENEIVNFATRFAVKPKVFIGYEREAFKGRADSSLRITFDKNIRFRTFTPSLCYGDGTKILSDGQYLMEIKFSLTPPEELANLLSVARAYPTSFSKYGKAYENFIAPELFNPHFVGANQNYFKEDYEIA